MPTGHPGKSFGMNWKGGAGPYINCIDGKLLSERSNNEFPLGWGKGT